MGDCDKDLELLLRLPHQQQQQEEKKKIDNSETTKVDDEEREVEVEEEEKKREEELGSSSSSSSSSSANNEIDHDQVIIETTNGDLQIGHQEDHNPEEADPIHHHHPRSIETLDGGELKDLSLQGQQEGDKSVVEEVDSEGGVETLGGELQNLSLDDTEGTEQQQVNPEAADPESTKTLDGELQNLSVEEENGNQEDSPEIDPDSVEILDGELGNTTTLEADPESIKTTLDGELQNLSSVEENGNQEDSPEADFDSIEIIDEKLGNTTTTLEGSLFNENQEDNPEGDSATSTEILDGELQNTSSEGPEGPEGEETTFKEDNKRKIPYPLRPGEPDCVYYLRTRMCRYGSHCRFNHPLMRKKQVQSAKHLPESVQVDEEEIEKVQSPERDGQQVYEGVNDKEKEKDKDREKYLESTRMPVCKYYLSGSCMFGKGCKNHHPREKTIVIPAKEFNFLGLPIRPGARECPFFMRTGSCKYATNCRFHHPDPTDTGGSDSTSEFQNGGSVILQESGSSQPPIAPWSLPGISNGAIPYMDASASYTTVMSLPNQVVHQNREWSGYQVPVSPVYPSDGNTGQRFAPAMNSSTRKADDSIMHHQQRMLDDEFPERPGQLECQYYMKTGNCKYRSACKFHHPKNRSTNSSVQRRTSFPQRPEICVHYSRHGICKYRPACKFYHPTSVL